MTTYLQVSLPEPLLRQVLGDEKVDQAIRSADSAIAEQRERTDDPYYADRGRGWQCHLSGYLGGQLESLMLSEIRSISGNTTTGR